MSDSFSRRRAHMIQLKARREGVETDVPRRHAAKAAFSKCPHCGAGVSKRELARTLYVCPQCGYHHPIGAYLRLSMLLDSKSFCELEERLAAPNTLGFPGDEEKLRAARKATGLTEGAVAARGKVDGSSAIFCVLDSRFLMGSMGAAVGEKVTRAVEYADRMGLPLVIFSASGGARMQEGILSLMQMAKTSAALGRFSSHGGFYLSVLTHPTTGGVTASFASLGDVTLAEPGALIGFAGPRVIEQTIGQRLPDGFQCAEYLEEHGFVDQIVSRDRMRQVISQLLRLHQRGGRGNG